MYIIIITVAAGTSTQTNIVVKHGGITEHIKLLDLVSDDIEIVDDVIWVLGNIDGDSKHWDINPYDDRPTLYTPVTQYEYYAQQNDLLKQIKVLKREFLAQVTLSIKATHQKKIRKYLAREV